MSPVRIGGQLQKRGLTGRLVGDGGGGGGAGLVCDLCLECAYDTARKKSVCEADRVLRG